MSRFAIMDGIIHFTCIAWLSLNAARRVPPLIQTYTHHTPRCHLVNTPSFLTNKRPQYEAIKFNRLSFPWTLDDRPGASFYDGVQARCVAAAVACLAVFSF